MDLNINIFSAFNDDWALLTAGTKDGFNTMAISWGGLGTLWSRPVATVYVKPIRYTHDFMDGGEYFTVSFFDKKYQRDIAYLGSHSGRDGDKLARTALTPKYLESAVTFEEAKTVLLCRKIYSQELELERIPADAVSDYYTEEAPHTMYVGEVVDIIKMQG